jgi:hypothetical protein
MARADFERALAIPQASGARPDRLLLVFRDPTVRFFIGALLQAVGLSVTAVTSIEEAMDVLQQPNLKIQLVLADRDECDLASWVGHYAVSRGLVPPLVLAVGTVKRSGGGIRYALSRDNALQPKMLDGAGLAAHVRHCLRR